jgi:hypothetical protein
MTLRRCPQCDSTVAVAEECRDCGYSFNIKEDPNPLALSGLFGIWVAVFGVWLLWQVMAAMVFFYDK